jgi:hypothetical protein
MWQPRVLNLNRKEKTQMNNQNEQKEENKNVSSPITPIKESISLILKKPIIILPIIIGTIVLRLLGVLLAPWTTDIFDWFWFADLTFFSIQTIMFNLLLFAVGAILVILVHFVSINMAKDAYLGEEPNIPKSVKYVLKNLPLFILAAFLVQLFLLTYILIPIGLIFIAMIVSERGTIGRALSKSVALLRRKPVEIIILTIAWGAWRLLLTQTNIPFTFSLSFIMDMIVEFGMLYLCLKQQ